MKTAILISLIAYFSSCSGAHKKTQEDNGRKSNDQVDLTEERRLDSLIELQDKLINELSQSSVNHSACPDSILDFFIKVENGDLVALKSYINSGGDAMLQCYDNTGPTPSLKSLSRHVMWSESFSMVAYYLTLTIDQRIKDDFLEYYCEEEQYDKFTKLIIDKGGRISTYSHICYPIRRDLYQRLIKLGYDINGTDKAGNTDFMHYAECPCPNGAEKVLKCLKMMKLLGADHTIKNKKDQTARSLASHPEIIHYLDSL